VSKRAVAVVRGAVLAAAAVGLVTVVALPAQGAFPGANGLLAYTEYDVSVERTDIGVMEPDGSDQTLLTSEGRTNVRAFWSADGTKIAYASDADGSDATEIWTMNADGSGKTRLTTNDVQDTAPTWSPDGTQLAYRSFVDGTHYDIMVINADGSGEHNITNSELDEFDPAWSPDGDTIAFVRRSSELEDFEIFAMDPDGSNIRQLTDDDVDTSGPDWSPDGSTIVYSRGTDLDYDLWVMDADGSGEELFYGTPTSAEGDPVYSPDGTKVAFTTYDGELQIATVDVDGTNAETITSAPAQRGDPNWQPLAVQPDPTTTVAPPTTVAPAAPTARPVSVAPRFTG
jgi:Tol biopolymer transport system component